MEGDSPPFNYFCDFALKHRFFCLEMICLFLFIVFYYTKYFNKYGVCNCTTRFRVSLTQDDTAAVWPGPYK